MVGSVLSTKVFVGWIGYGLRCICFGVYLWVCAGGVFFNVLGCVVCYVLWIVCSVYDSEMVLGCVVVGVRDGLKMCLGMCLVMVCVLYVVVYDLWGVIVGVL